MYCTLVGLIPRGVQRAQAVELPFAVAATLFAAAAAAVRADRVLQFLFAKNVVVVVVVGALA